MEPSGRVLKFDLNMTPASSTSSEILLLEKARNLLRGNKLSAVDTANNDLEDSASSRFPSEIVEKIVETSQKHLPFSFYEQEGQQKLMNIAVSFEKNIYSAATDESDYLRMISLQIQNPMADSLLTLNAANTSSTERLAAPITEEDVPDSLSLKDSLAAICNATQAAARIHQNFRIQSFQRKQFVEQGSDESSSADEHALSLIAAKTGWLGKHDGTAHAAAITIQKMFCGWKKRKEFIIIRQRIVKIQAHVRGHQVRKHYKSIIWSVGILEKVFLRWSLEGSGLRGFRPDAATKCPSTEDVPRKDDDYDFLKDGRKQSEQRLQKALARVKSLTQYPEARAQYRRLLTVVEGFRENEQDTSSMILKGSEDVSYTDEELLYDVPNLLDDDTFMPIAFE